MADELLTLRQVARMMGLSEQRVYQLDRELHPVLVQRGEKMQTRHYKQSAVERAIRRRAEGVPRKRKPNRELDVLASSEAGSWLKMIAEHPDTTFGSGLSAKDAESVKKRVLRIAARLARGSS